MTAIATYQVSPCISDRIAFHPEGAGCGHLGQRRSEQVKAMAGFAAGFVLSVKLAVASIPPAAVVYIMEAVGAVGG